MANWTRATLLKRLAVVVADELNAREGTADVTPFDVIEGDALGGMTAAELIGLVKAAVLREAMG